MGKEWPAIVIQGIILGNISILAAAKINGYLIISALIIVSLFILQSISRRYLLLFPLNIFMNKPVQSLDTIILKTFIFLSVVSFFFGYAHKPNQYITFKIEEFLMSNIFWFAMFFLLFTPLIWLLFYRKCSDNKVVEKLRKSEFKYLGKCKKCDSYAFIEHKVIDKERSQRIYECEKCGSYPEDVKLNITY